AVTTVLQEVVPDKKIVGREKFDEAWYPGDAIVTQELSDENGGTLLTVTIRYESKAARDGVLKTPMTDGMSHTYDQLENILSLLN
ncbi:MAG: SRPBCC domain-containing protein, partial [Hyphomicrobiaceae bacterium]